MIPETSRFIMLTQTWGGVETKIVQQFFCNRDYPLWLTVSTMDMQLYRKVGLLLPERQWQVIY